MTIAQISKKRSKSYNPYPKCFSMTFNTQSMTRNRRKSTNFEISMINTISFFHEKNIWLLAWIMRKLFYVFPSNSLPGSNDLCGSRGHTWIDLVVTKSRQLTLNFKHPIPLPPYNVNPNLTQFCMIENKCVCVCVCVCVLILIWVSRIRRMNSWKDPGVVYISSKFSS